MKQDVLREGSETVEAFVSSVMQFLGSAAAHLMDLGYIGMWIALFIEGIGLPFPGDALLMFYGFTAGAGQFSPAKALALCWLGFLCGSLFAYLLSRQIGRLIARPTAMPPKPTLTRVNQLIAKFGPIILIPGRLLPGVRSMSSYAAGVSSIKPLTFLWLTALGGLLYVSVWFFGGYFFGQTLKAEIAAHRSDVVYISLTILAVGLVLWWQHKRR